MKEREINLSALIKAILIRWRALLIFAVLFAALLGGYRLKKLWPQQAQSSLTTSEAVSGEKTQQDVLDNSIKSKQEYLNNSLLLQIDPAHEGRAEVEVYISTDELQKEAEEGVIFGGALESEQDNNYSAGTSFMTAAQKNANRILNRYMNCITSSVDWRELETELGTEGQYLQELVQIYQVREDLVGATICVRHSDAGIAERILNYILDQIKSNQEQIIEELGNHSLILENQTSMVVVDPQLFTTVSLRIKEMNDLITYGDTYRDNQEKIGDVVAEESKQKGLSRSAILKSGIKHAVLGFVVGCILFGVVYAIYLIVSGKILSARELNEQYALRKLATVPNNSVSKSRIDRLVNRIDEHYITDQDPTVCCEIANANVRAHLEGSKVAVVSDLPREQIEKWCDDLNKITDEVCYIALANPQNDPRSLEELRACDAALLLSGVLHSTHRQTQELLQLLTDDEKTILGSITI